MSLVCLPLVMLGLHRQNPRSTAATVSANLSKVFAACWIQISPEKNANTKTKQWWERSFMVTELFIKSPVPGIDEEWGRWTKEVDGGREGMARHRVVMSPESCINRHMRWTKRNMAALVRWGHDENNKDTLRLDPAARFKVYFQDWLWSNLCHRYPKASRSPHDDLKGGYMSSWISYSLISPSSF